MCGIVGYVGFGNAVPYLVNGLRKLEYRGYDSSGIVAYIGNTRQGFIPNIKTGQRYNTRWFKFADSFFQFRQ